MAADAVPVPPQVQQPALYDFRRAATAPKGFKASRKRKMEELEEQAEADQAQLAMQAEPSDGQPAKRKKLRPTRVSGKNWKAASQRMSATTGTSQLKTSWDQKMAAKAEAQLFKEQKAEARAERNSQLSAERERRKVVKERKQANQQKALKSVGQKISNPATLKRMLKSKKQRKHLVTADTN